MINEDFFSRLVDRRTSGSAPKQPLVPSPPSFPLYRHGWYAVLLEERWLQWPSQLPSLLLSSPTSHATQNSFCSSSARIVSWIWSKSMLMISWMTFSLRKCPKPRMLLLSVCPEEYMFACVVEILRKRSSTGLGAQIHGLVIKFGCMLWQVRATLWYVLVVD